MRSIDEVLSLYRGYGIRAQLYYQSLAQLKKCFPDGQDQTVLANATQMFFAVNDESADYVSRRLGDATIIVESGGSGSGTSTQRSPTSSQSSTTHSTNTSRNWNQVGRRLLKTEELYTIGERTGITFVPGMPPIMTTLERYYECKMGPERWRGTKTLLATLFLLVAATIFAAVGGDHARCAGTGPENSGGRKGTSRHSPSQRRARVA
ncbi:MAG: hypothetical protein B7Z73_19135, partial [Planctomycetia bacterium 21-64-5]